MKYVLVNPLTQEPTAVEFPAEMAKITSGQHQNVAEVTDEWYAAALLRATLANLQQSMEEMLTALVGAAVAAEREACALIAEDYHHELSGRWDSATALEIATAIRARK